ncbi:hypothetical protein V2E24_02680 [Mycoplasmopsis ciconiae]|uniref:Lipoprotein n=1 Tax=Mycoplasmopsis ciconiae TaxID=561067 RepID=A0ABU7MLS6_9BACT|nr:hypothetical protein [Mycoplasmopsis ciconiae]
MKKNKLKNIFLISGSFLVLSSVAAFSLSCENIKQNQKKDATQEPDTNAEQNNELSMFDQVNNLVNSSQELLKNLKEPLISAEFARTAWGKLKNSLKNVSKDSSDLPEDVIQGYKNLNESLEILKLEQDYLQQIDQYLLSLAEYEETLSLLEESDPKNKEKVIIQQLKASINQLKRNLNVVFKDNQKLRAKEEVENLLKAKKQEKNSDLNKASYYVTLQKLNALVKKVENELNYKFSNVVFEQLFNELLAQQNNAKSVLASLQLENDQVTDELVANLTNAYNNLSNTLATNQEKRIELNPELANNVVFDKVYSNKNAVDEFYPVFMEIIDNYKEQLSLLVGDSLFSVNQALNELTNRVNQLKSESDNFQYTNGALRNKFFTGSAFNESLSDATNSVTRNILLPFYQSTVFNIERISNRRLVEKLVDYSKLKSVAQFFEVRKQWADKLSEELDKLEQTPELNENIIQRIQVVRNLILRLNNRLNEFLLISPDSKVSLTTLISNMAEISGSANIIYSSLQSLASAKLNNANFLSSQKVRELRSPSIFLGNINDGQKVSVLKRVVPVQQFINDIQDFANSLTEEKYSALKAEILKTAETYNWILAGYKEGALKYLDSQKNLLSEEELDKIPAYTFASSSEELDMFSLFLRNKLKEYKKQKEALDASTNSNQTSN